LVSVVMGGGYGTGREVVEYFSRYGTLGGLLGLSVSGLVFALVISLTFELARMERAYDYRSFFRMLIGRFWPAFEVLYVVLLLLVLGVIGSASGQIIDDRFGVPTEISTVLMLVLIATIVVAGRAGVTKFLTYWCFVMYAVFVAYFIAVFIDRGDSITLAFREANVQHGWMTAGLIYPMYNLAAVPAVLFAVRGIESRRDSIVAGVISALLLVAPAAMFHVSYAGNLGQVAELEIPNYWMVEDIGIGLLTFVFVIAVFGTLIETGVGLIHGVIERIESVTFSPEKQTLSPGSRAVFAIACISLAGVLSSFGVITLIAKGYSMLAIGFALVYVLPLCTIGMYRIATRSAHRPNGQSTRTVDEAS